LRVGLRVKGEAASFLQSNRCAQPDFQFNVLEPCVFRHTQRLQEQLRIGGKNAFLGADGGGASESAGVDEELSCLIDSRDVTCVSLAGLVHDLGHGE
jgi:hypothetical protein